MCTPIFVLLLTAGLGSPAPHADPGALVDLDADGDGLPGALDLCPGTPGGFPVDADGCALDSDADGVADGLDRCPGTLMDPGGGAIDDHGCSVRDQKRERPFRYPIAIG